MVLSFLLSKLAGTFSKVGASVNKIYCIEAARHAASQKLTGARCPTISIALGTS
jgi:hypothetical protein